jgi:hypothetical protein
MSSQTDSSGEPDRNPGTLPADVLRRVVGLQTASTANLKEQWRLRPRRRSIEAT